MNLVAIMAVFVLGLGFGYRPIMLVSFARLPYYYLVSVRRLYCFDGAFGVVFGAVLLNLSQNCHCCLGLRPKFVLLHFARHSTSIESRYVSVWD